MAKNLYTNHTLKSKQGHEGLEFGAKKIRVKIWTIRPRQRNQKKLVNLLIFCGVILCDHYEQLDGTFFGTNIKKECKGVQ